MRLRTVQFLVPCVALISLLFLGGCSSLQTFDQLTASEQKKEQLLGERLERFSKAVYWGAFEEATTYVAAQSRSKFLREQQARRANERLVDIEIKDLQFEDNSSIARVEWQIRYFGSPTYHVQSRRERQIWQYDRFNGGWFYLESSELPSDVTGQNLERPHIPVSMNRRS